MPEVGRDITADTESDKFQRSLGPKSVKEEKEKQPIFGKKLKVAQKALDEIKPCNDDLDRQKRFYCSQLALVDHIPKKLENISG